MYFQFVGITGWLIVGILWNDWSLIVVNIVGSTIMLIGILHYHFFTDWYLNIYEYTLKHEIYNRRMARYKISRNE